MSRNFAEWLLTFTDSIANYRYYIDFETIYKNAEEYKVELSIQAKEDYKSIISYIKYNLLEPNIAEGYAELIKNEINTLKYNPERFAIIDYDIIKQYKIRKLIVKKYIVFYRINQDKKIVNIERILYSTTEWKNKI